MRFESLLDSVIENVNVISRYMESKNEVESVPVTEAPFVVVGKYSRRNFFRVPSREAIRLEGDAANNQIIATADGTSEQVPELWRSGQSSFMGRSYKPYEPRDYNGTSRTYIKPDAGASLLNLGIMDVRKINHPKAGDIAVHDGSGMAVAKPCFVMFDGNDWVCLTPGEKLKKE